MEFRTATADSELDNSTAPTTPDGSLTFSPALQALKLQDALERESLIREKETKGFETLDNICPSSNIDVKNICCIGAGYVGGPTAAVMAYHNPHLKITVVDRDQSRIKQWNSNHLPLYEPGLYEILRAARDGTKFIPQENDAGASTVGSQPANSSIWKPSVDGSQTSGRQPNLFFSTDISTCISEADMILIAVNTPTKMKGLGAGRATDMTALEAVTKQIAIYAKPGAILVEKSTVPCRTSQFIYDTLKTYRPNIHFEILSNPEFLSAGTAIADLISPSRVLIGSQPTRAGYLAASALERVYSWIDPSKIMHTNTYSSELAKLVANAMLAQRISSINSISAICEKTGADIQELSKAVGADARIGAKYLKAGVGFGGSCFGKDIRSLVYLAETLGLPEVAEYWQQVLKINEWQRTRFASKIVQRLNGTLVNKKITVLGYAFKKETDDTRESPALETIRILLEDAPREVAIFDPFCDPRVVRDEIGRLCGAEMLRENDGPVVVYEDAYEACLQSHGVVIMTDCDEFSNISSISVSVPDISSGLTVEYLKELECEVDCTACTFEKEKAAKRDVGNDRLDWARIAYHLNKPRWIFDGRDVLNASEIGKLDVRVEGIGRVSWDGL